MQIKFWGTRGSIPVPGENTIKYGGNTPCVEVRTKDDNIIILDAGSGIRELGKALCSEDFTGHLDIMLSHYHWDHIQGIPFFGPLYNEKNDVTVYGQNTDGKNVIEVLNYQMVPNHFPIDINDFHAKMNFVNIPNNKSFEVSGLKIDTFKANHPSNTISYKLTENGKSLVYLPDNELKLNDFSDNQNPEQIKELNSDLIDFCKGCDYLIHDTMYDEDLIKKKQGWGHSSNVALAYFGIMAEVKHLILFHYNPDYFDDKIDKMCDETERVIHEYKSDLKCIPAKEGLIIET